MATTAKTIGRDWQQITDGTQEAFVQIFGSADACDSPVKPGEDHPAHSFSNRELTITKGTVFWVRSSWFEGNIRVVIS